jgi:hypothetical protein
VLGTVGKHRVGRASWTLLDPVRLSAITEPKSGPLLRFTAAYGARIVPCQAIWPIRTDVAPVKFQISEWRHAVTLAGGLFWKSE